MSYELKMNTYEVIIIGAGHAGIEASFACARLGLSTLMLTLDANTIGLMSCNPAIGGVGKGQLVKEIDALGGEMAKAADITAIQYRRLNMSKGAAVVNEKKFVLPVCPQRESGKCNVSCAGIFCGRFEFDPRPGFSTSDAVKLDESGELTILPDVLRAELPSSIRDRVPIAAVGGPCIAGELAGRRQSCVVFGSRDAEAVERLARAFRTPYYHVWTTTDLVGLEYCAAFKNAYTLGVALAFGLLEKAGGADAAGAHMHNLAAALFGEACNEMARLLEVAGATRAFAYGLSGAGDLYVTCVGGRTIRMGTLLGKGHTAAEARTMLAGLTLEGAEIVAVMGRALPGLVARGKLGAEELPLLRALIDVVVNSRPVELLLDRFFGGQGRV